MAGIGGEKMYSCITDGFHESFLTEESVHKNKHHMALSLEPEPGLSASQTRTPIVVESFPELEEHNPFDQTFRQAIRSGSASLGMSSLTISNNYNNNADESLHTPHIILPTTDQDNLRNHSRPSTTTSVVQVQSDPLCITLDTEMPRESVIQQEADTSDDTHSTQLVETITAHDSDAARGGTVQFLIRTPDGKLVQLCPSLPVEVVQAATSAAVPRSMPANSAADVSLKTMSSSSSISSSSSSSIGCGNASGSMSSGVSSLNDFTMKQHPPKLIEDITHQSPSNSLVKQRLKQVLMSNSSPAAVASSSASTVINSSMASSPPMKIMPTRRPASVSDDNSNFGRNEDSQVEEKRRRNRAAAMRCREKRKTWVQELERRANDMMRTNGQLQYEVSLLRDEVAQLKTLLLAHRDCPVTQALVQGQSDLLAGINMAVPSSNPGNTQATVQTKTQTSTRPSPVTKTSTSTVKPVILLNDPPPKRKRQHVVANKSASGATSSPSSAPSTTAPSSLAQTLVISSLPKSSTVLNSSYMNLLPGVLVTNPATTSTRSATSSQMIAISSVVPPIPAHQTQKQMFILPKVVGSYLSDESITPSKQPKLRSNQILSTNVIKVNPNAVDRDNTTSDSDIEVIDVRTADR